MHSIRSSRYALLHDVILSNTFGIFFKATLLPLRGSVTDLAEEDCLGRHDSNENNLQSAVQYSPHNAKSTIADRSIRMICLRLHLRSIMSVVEDGSSLRVSCRKSHKPTTTSTLAQSHPALNPIHTWKIFNTYSTMSWYFTVAWWATWESKKRVRVGSRIHSLSIKLPWPTAPLSCSPTNFGTTHMWQRLYCACVTQYTRAKHPG